MALPQGFSLKALLENPDLLNPPKINDLKKEKEKKEKDDSLEQMFSSQSAFLGPQIWGDDLKLEFMDLDDFLLETGLEDTTKPAAITTTATTGNNAVVQAVPRAASPSLQSLLESTVNPTTQLSPNHLSDDSSLALNLSVDKGEIEQHVRAEEYGEISSPREGSTSPVDLPFTSSDLALATIPGQEGFDPRRRAFTEEELRPQPMIRKSRKVFVDNESKDDKYWARRRKNNVAAKRSRDARRVKENQIAMRASFLERQNDKLTLDVAEARRENEELRRKLAKYEGR